VIKTIAYRSSKLNPDPTSPNVGRSNRRSASARGGSGGGRFHHALCWLTVVSAALTAPLALSAPAPQTPAPAAKIQVDLELVLASDNSGSIDRSEALLQRQGVAAAFKHPDVVRAIQSGTYGRIAVAYVDWSSLPFSRLTLDWRVVSDKASADAVADALLRAPLVYGQGTAIGETLLIAARLLETNNYDGTQKSIDVSGDGPNNTGPPVHTVRDEIVMQRITINGLPVISTGDYGQGDWGIYYGKLEEYYLNCVIGGPRSFAIPAKGFEEFASAVRRKLVLEISDASPAPSPLIRVGAAPNASPPPTPLRPPQSQNSENCGRGFRFF
jgi:hypothetical protein